MFTLGKKEFKIGEYEITIYPRYFKDFKTPLYFSWIFEEKPLMVIKKNKRNVFIRKNEIFEIKDESISKSKLFNSIKNVKELIAINNGLYEGLEIMSKDIDYVFDENDNAVKSTKPDINLMIDDIPSLSIEKLEALDYCKKTMNVISYNELIKKDFVEVIETIEYCSISNDYIPKEKIIILYDDIDKEIHKKNMDDYREHLDKVKKLNAEIGSTGRKSGVYFTDRFYKGKKLYEEIPFFMYVYYDRTKTKSIKTKKFRIKVENREMSLSINRTCYNSDFKLALKRKVIFF